jgi:hypothetical protein
MYWQNHWFAFLKWPVMFLVVMTIIIYSTASDRCAVLRLTNVVPLTNVSIE